MNFEFIDYIDIKDAKILNEYVEKRMVNSEKYYLFFDEIQNVANWEKAINSFKAKYQEKVSILHNMNFRLRSLLKKNLRYSVPSTWTRWKLNTL